MNKVIDKGFRSCRFVSTIVKHPVLNFVAGHGTVVHPVSIIIVFGCKQAQQYSRTHQLVSSELSVGVHKTLNRIGRTCISLLKYCRTSVFLHFTSVGYSAI